MKNQKQDFSNLAFVFYMHNGSHGYWHPTVRIRQAFQNDETGKTYYSKPYEKWAESFEISSQIDSECAKIYAVKPKIEISPNHFETAAKIMKQIRDKSAKYLSTNPRPQTFGAYVFMIAKAIGINTVIFDRNPHGRSDYDVYSLVDSVWQIDRRINETTPHIKEPVDFY